MVIDRISNKIDDTRNDVRKMVNHISTKFTGPIPGVQEGDIPLNPIKANFKDIKFWKQGPYQALRNKTRNDARGEAVYSIFMEDQFGNPIPGGVRTALREDVHKFWLDMIKEREVPTKYSKVGFKTSEDFRKTMEGKYQWLRLCEGHWKVKQVWRNCFTAQWKAANIPVSLLSGNTDDTDDTEDNEDIEGTEDAVDKDVIEVTSSEDDTLAGSKRGREDNLHTGPSKKHKGKEAVKPVLKPAFHHARPLPKKKANVKVAKVSTPPFPFDAYLLRNALGRRPIVLIFFASSGRRN